MILEEDDPRSLRHDKPGSHAHVTSGDCKGFWVKVEESQAVEKGEVRGVWCNIFTGAMRHFSWLESDEPARRYTP